MSRESELERLIKEQEQDEQDGSVQRPESGVLRLDRFEDRLQSDGTFVSSKRRDHVAQRWECMAHGSEHMTEGPPSYKARGLMFRCGACHRESVRRWKAVNKPWKRDNEKTTTAKRVRRFRARERDAE